ncbi:hypothetical protein A3J11_00550 [Candidatus Kaiserbacteria bacterium RIFCSPLOWO2_02_FULL_55_12]|uniref:Uncharacterized protein n=2 Tax=Candidatus Kaiseribacteriota TaxID=1752734 RepID=A0A1F6EZ96_9BACT|nr:MAG: hypothetical protein A3C94_03255 [Candidatus Kaiserbacteria bacterium RIFCSPHIGHO2_02_FULL_55_17]OGG78928.1 MAG: hypothetical protein A3J11_00550 [Candidatus Kaiserbacteria bacterium RIFCSPLOWO2_02_FULL_55_12]
MGQILSNWRVLTATFFAVVLIIGAYMLARNAKSPPLALASAEMALLQAIAARDSDGDGLPDWEEALYGTNPNITDTRNLGMTDGEAVAKGLIVPKAIADIRVATSSDGMIVDPDLPTPGKGTLTAAFAEHFFTLYLAAREANGGNDLSEAQMNDVAMQALDALAAAIAGSPDYKSERDLNIKGSGADRLREYAAQAESVLLSKTADASKSGIEYLQDGVQRNDAEAFTHLASLAKVYRESAVGLAALAVPEELIQGHLALVNAMMRLSEIMSDFARANTDPLATMLALKQYPGTMLTVGNAFFSIAAVYKNAGVTVPDGSLGAAFIYMMDSVAREQAKP